MNPKKTNGKAEKICLFGHFGMFNWGNDSTIKAILCNLRLFRPDAEIICITTGPEALAATEKIKTVPVRRNFNKSETSQSRLGKLVRRIFIGGPGELYRWFEAFKTLKGTEMLIIPGTGLLTDAYGLRGWGPYNLFKWSLMGKLRGAKLLFLSVGAGPFYSAPGKWLVKSTLRMANFRSYRDDASMNWLKRIGFQTDGDRIYPDLVFSLPESVLPQSENKGGRRRVAGLGVMVYAGKYSVAEPSDAIYQQYLENLAVFAEWLLARNYDIRLLTGDVTDQPVTEELKSLLRKRLPGFDESRIIDGPVASVEQILSEVVETDIVVATRFHNVLLALLLNKPVIAISFHHKCASLMSQMGLSEYTHDINSMNADRLIEQFLDVEKKNDQLKLLIRERVEQSRKALDEQYNLIFKEKTTKVIGEQPSSGVLSYVK